MKNTNHPSSKGTFFTSTPTPTRFIRGSRLRLHERGSRSGLQLADHLGRVAGPRRSPARTYPEYWPAKRLRSFDELRRQARHGSVGVGQRDGLDVPTSGCGTAALACSP